jgi:hypothetical protein
MNKATPLPSHRIVDENNSARNAGFTQKSID